MKQSADVYVSWVRAIKCGAYSGLTVLIFCYLYFLFSNDGSKVAFESALPLSFWSFVASSVAVKVVTWADSGVSF